MLGNLMLGSPSQPGYDGRGSLVAVGRRPELAHEEADAADMDSEPMADYLCKTQF